MARTPFRTTSPIAGAALMLAVLTVAAACGAVGSASPSPSSSPSSSPSAPAPSAPASPAPSADPSPAPSVDPSAAPGDGAIRLDVADPHAVSVVVAAPAGVLASAASGRAGDGMSVRWGDVRVENLDADTIRVTWVGLPQDGVVRLALEARGEGYALSIRQPAPPANSDAVGFDRVLVLDFAAPVNAEAIAATVADA